MKKKENRLEATNRFFNLAMKISQDEEKDTEYDVASGRKGGITTFTGHMLLRSMVCISQRTINLTMIELIIGLQ